MPSPQHYNLPHDAWRKYQEESVDWIRDNNHRLMIMEAPVGCHAKGQGILMADGTIKAVEGISIGDLVMGMNSRPRMVIDIHRGHDEMFLVSPVKGNPFVVNRGHILSLVRTGRRRTTSKNHPNIDLGGEIIDISVGSWLDWPNHKKADNKLFRRGVDKFDVRQRKLLIDPYILGVFIGDGALTKGALAVINENESEIIDRLYQYSREWGLEITSRNRNGAEHINFITGDQGGKNNPLIDKIRLLGLDVTSGKKFIPHEYKISSREDRLKLVAGLFDTDGHNGGGYCDYVTKSKVLAEDIAFVCRSLGLAAYISESEKYSQNGVGGIYYRLSISGDLSVIPCLSPRMQFRKRRQKKSVLRTGISIKSIGMGEYYGFEIDGDGRYLLDDFTVTHNSGKSAVAAAAGSNGTSVTALTLTLALQYQYHEQYGFFHLYGMSNYDCDLNVTLKADMCQHLDEMFNCPVADYCQYLIARSDYQSARRRTTNYHYFLSAPWMPQHQTTYLFCDEAHKLPEIIERHMSLEMSWKDADNLDVPIFPTKDVKSSGIRLMLAHNWLGKCIDSLEPRIDKLKARITFNPKLILKLRELEKWYNSIMNCYLGIDKDRENWFVHYDEEKIKIIPLDVSEYFYPLFADPFFHKIVMMSATIGNFKAFAGSLGIEDYSAYSVPNQFRPNERPVWTFRDAPRMSYNAPMSAWEKQADIIAGVFKKGPPRPGIIHLNSISKTEALANRLARRGYQDRVFIPKGKGTSEKLRDLHNTIKRKKDGIALTWAMSEGVDLPDFYYNISADVPFWGLGSPDGMAKMKANPAFYRWSAATQLQQRAGRTRRGVPEHYDIDGKQNGFVAIVDNNVSILEDSLSDDFKASMENVN